jgi:hypothetical protein
MDNTFARALTNDPVPELLGDLSDALEILYSCRRMAVPVTDEFLEHIESLIDQIEANRPYSISA